MTAPLTRRAPAAPAFLPYGRQAIDEDDVAAVAAVLRSDYLTTGPAVAAFERAFSQAVGAPHAVACANGTAALHLAMMALDVGPGDAVVVPTITFTATANGARFCGAEVIFADVDSDTALMTPDNLREALARANGRPVKAILPVHFAGAAADTAEIAAIARDCNAAIVEDACHAVGATRTDGRIGDCLDAAMCVFSFHPVKTIAAGEGGMVTTRDPALAQRLAQLRSHGLVREPEDFIDPGFSRDADGGEAPWAYEMQALGYNYRLSDIHAALGLSQLKKLSAFAARRRSLAALYAHTLAPLAPLVRPLRMTDGACPHLCVVLIDFEAAGLSRGETMRRLRAAGVGAQVHYMPVHRQPYYRARYGPLDLPGAECYYKRCLSLPLYAAMTDDDVLRVADSLCDALS